MTHAKQPLKAGSQCTKLLGYLARGKSITTMEAFRRFGITTASQRFGELRRRGHDIEAVMVTLKSGARVALYRLRRAGYAQGKRSGK